jgi:methionyl-tRNA formyltransferase
VKLCIAGKNLIAVEALTKLSPAYALLCLPNSSDDGEDDWQPSLRRAASNLSVPIVALADLYSMSDLCFLSLEYEAIIRPDRFATDKLFNIHFSLLPKYRGCNTAVWPILNGEHEHGATLHCIDHGVDTGPTIAQRSFPLDDMTAFEAYMACQHAGLDLAIDWVDRLVSGEFTATPQGDGTCYPRAALDYSLAEIDLSESAEQVMRRIRAFTFPVFQRPTYRAATIYGASFVARKGWLRLEAKDGPIFVNLADSPH